jgi:hypothetical protein
VSAKHRFHVGAPPAEDRLNQGDCLSPADDSDPLAAVLHRIEQVREVSCGVGGADLSHNIRLSDTYCLGYARTLSSTIPEYRRTPVTECRLCTGSRAPIR